MACLGPLLGGLLGMTAACGRSCGRESAGGEAAPLPPGATTVAPTALSGLPPPPAPGHPVVPVPGAPPSFAELVKRADPAVASVRAVVRKDNAFGQEVALDESKATGFVYDPKGYLLTNDHVVAEAGEITVTLADGRELKATVVGRDKPTDVAVLKIDAEGLVALPFGDSDAVQVGDWVVAIGNPFGLAHTVSAGIVSAKDRTRDDVPGLDPTGYFNFLQTDASINPGSSGGPLLDMAGQVVGINAAVKANANNIGFAIPVNMVRQLLPLLVKDGRIRRSAIGVWVEPVLAPEGPTGTAPHPKGALVKRVIAGGPADHAGLAVGDVIQAFEGKPVADPNELRWLASIAGVGTTVTLRVARGSRVFETRLTLSELPEQQE
jgi:serine protease Do